MPNLLYWPQRVFTWLFLRTGCFYIPLICLAVMAWLFVTIFNLPQTASAPVFLLVVFGGAFFLVWLFMLPFIALDRNLKDANQQHLHSGGAWVEWVYTPEEWQQFIAAEQTKLGGDALGTLIAGGVFGCIGTFLVGIIFRTPLAVAIVVCLSFGLTLLALLRSIRALNRRKNPRSPIEIRLNGLGIEELGTYTQLAGIGQAVQEVTLATGKPSIIRIVSRRRSGKHTILSEVRIPVPRGREAEADALVARFMNPAAEGQSPSEAPERANRALA